MDALAVGRQKLSDIMISGNLTGKVYAFNDNSVVRRLTESDLPLTSDPFFLETDESSPETLQKLKSLGAILIDDLLTPEDRGELGWPVLFGDYLGLLSNLLAARSAYFVGSSGSSLTGVCLNLRMAMGLPARTAVMLYE